MKRKTTLFLIWIYLFSVPGMPVAFAETDLSRCGYTGFKCGLLKRACPNDEICSKNFGPDFCSYSSECVDAAKNDDSAQGGGTVQSVKNFCPMEGTEGVDFFRRTTDTGFCDYTEYPDGNPEKACCKTTLQGSDQWKAVVCGNEAQIRKLQNLVCCVVGAPDWDWRSAADCKKLAGDDTLCGIKPSDDDYRCEVVGFELKQERKTCSLKDHFNPTKPLQWAGCWMLGNGDPHYVAFWQKFPPGEDIAWKMLLPWGNPGEDALTITMVTYATLDTATLTYGKFSGVGTVSKKFAIVSTEKAAKKVSEKTGLTKLYNTVKDRSVNNIVVMRGRNVAKSVKKGGAKVQETISTRINNLKASLGWETDKEVMEGVFGKKMSKETVEYSKSHWKSFVAVPAGATIGVAEIIAGFLDSTTEKFEDTPNSLVLGIPGPDNDIPFPFGTDEVKQYPVVLKKTGFSKLRGKDTTFYLVSPCKVDLKISTGTHKCGEKLVCCDQTYQLQKCSAIIGEKVTDADCYPTEGTVWTPQWKGDLECEAYCMPGKSCVLSDDNCEASFNPAIFKKPHGQLYGVGYDQFLDEYICDPVPAGSDGEDVGSINVEETHHYADGSYADENFCFTTRTMGHVALEGSADVVAVASLIVTRGAAIGVKEVVLEWAIILSQHMVDVWTTWPGHAPGAWS